MGRNTRVLAKPHLKSRWALLRLWLRGERSVRSLLDLCNLRNLRIRNLWTPACLCVSECGGALGSRTVTQDAPQTLQTVPPSDFFPFRVGAPVIGDGNLEHAPATLRNLRGNLLLEPESVLSQVEVL